jgi:hypothetical protein
METTHHGPVLPCPPLFTTLQVLLCLGYCHLLHLRDPAACLKCCEALRQLETEQAAHPAVALLAFQAFRAQGSLEQAEKEATGEHDSALDYVYGVLADAEHTQSQLAVPAPHLHHHMPVRCANKYA